MKISDEIKQGTFDNVYLKAFINVLFTGNFLRYQQQQTLKPYGITSQQFNVLKILKGAQPRSLQANEIKKVMIDKSPDLTRLINRMIKNGWVNRAISKTSRREVAISITKDGLDILQKTNPLVLKNVSLMNNLNEDEAELLSNLLDKVRYC
jgi:DNA-binding MarR family transcriptional regulator